MGRLLCLPALLLTLAVGCTRQGSPPPADRVTGEDLRRETGEALETAGKYSRERMAEFQKEAQEKLNDLEGQVEKLRAKAARATEDARKRLQPEIDALEKEAADLRQRLARLPEQGAQAWKAARPELERSLEGLQEAFRKASAKFHE